MFAYFMGTFIYSQCNVCVCVSLRESLSWTELIWVLQGECFILKCCAKTRQIVRYLKKGVSYGCRFVSASRKVRKGQSQGQKVTFFGPEHQLVLVRLYQTSA